MIRRSCVGRLVFVSREQVMTWTVPRLGQAHFHQLVVKRVADLRQPGRGNSVDGDAAVDVVD
jgi:hypothetical protein